MRSFKFLDRYDGHKGARLPPSKRCRTDDDPPSRQENLQEYDQSNLLQSRNPVQGTLAAGIMLIIIPLVYRAVDTSVFVVSCSVTPHMSSHFPEADLAAR